MSVSRPQPALLLLCGLLVACDGGGDDDTGSGGGDGVTCGAEALAGTQGVYGRVRWLEGDHMPGDGSGGTAEGLATTVAAFDPVVEATADTADPEAYGRYDLGEAVAVATVTSSADGCYALALGAGDYTVVADDSGAWFCNSSGPDGLCVVTVASGEAAEWRIDIDYRASY